MRVYISVDMEGVAGIVHGEQTRRGQSGFAEACELMTGEANAAALGAFEAGASEVLVNDSHGDMRNLVFDRLDPRVQVLTGSLKQFSMAEGLDAGGFSIALFIGYHAAMGTPAAILDHTYRGAVVSEVRVNGLRMNEAGLNALVAGQAGTAVGLVTGDDSTCMQSRALLGEVDTMVVKWAVGRLAARSLHPQEARRRIQAAATRAVLERNRFRPFVLDPPYDLELDMVTTSCADAASLMPGAMRVSGRTMRLRSNDVGTLFRGMLALIRLGSTAL